jgi:hypothetical protein
MLQWLYIYIASVCSKCFSCFIRMLNVFYGSVAYVLHLYCKFHSNVVYVSHIICNVTYVLQWLHMCFPRVSDVCCRCFNCFRRILHMFPLDIAKVDLVLHML